MPPASLERAARIGRGFLATAALFLLGLWTLVALTVGICGLRLSLERLREPWMWCLLGSYPVPLAALPPFSRRLLGRPWRWALVPSLLAVAGFTYAMVRDLDPREPGSFALPLVTVVPLLVCVAYLVPRVLLKSTS